MEHGIVLLQDAACASCVLTLVRFVVPSHSRKAEVQHWDDMELIWRHVYSEMKACG